MAQNFPFVIIPPDISARSLRSQKPFLFGTVMLAATRIKISDQKPMRETLMEYHSIRLLVNGEKNIDLLQGILVYIAWFVCELLFCTSCFHWFQTLTFIFRCNHLYRYNPQITNLIQLAIAMIVELGHEPNSSRHKWRFMAEIT